MKDYWIRLLAFVRGDFSKAEGMAEMPDIGEVPWIQAAAQSQPKADYALEASLRSAADASNAVKEVQSKASSLFTTVLTLFSLAIAVTILVVPSSGDAQWASIVAFLLFLVVDFALVLSAVMCFLAYGLILSGGSNPARFSDSDAASLASLKAAEADAWYFATELAFWAGKQRAKDLFAARRLLVMALITAILATPFLYAAKAGTPTQERSPVPRRQPVAHTISHRGAEPGRCCPRCRPNVLSGLITRCQ